MFNRIRSALPTVPPELVTVGASGAIGWGLATLQRQAEEAAEDLQSTLGALEHHTARLATLTAETAHAGQRLKAVHAEIEAAEERLDTVCELRRQLGEPCSCTAESCPAPIHSWPAQDTNQLAGGEPNG